MERHEPDKKPLERTEEGAPVVDAAGRPEQEVRADRRFWSEELGGDPPLLGLPADLPRRRAAEGGAPARDRVRLAPAPELTRRLLDLCRGRDSLLLTVLLSAARLLLRAYAEGGPGGGDDGVLGTPVHLDAEGEGAGRNRLVPVRLPVEPAWPLRRVVERAGSALARSYRHQGPALEEIRALLGVEAAPDEPALFACIVALEPLNVLEHAAAAPSEAVFAFRREGEELAGWIDYDASRFLPATVEAAAAHYLRVLDRIAHQPDLPVGELRLAEAGPEAFTDLVGEAASLPADAPSFEPVHLLFARQARRTPAAPAVEHGGESWSYAELAGRAAAVTAGLRRRGVGAGDRVAILMEHSVHLVAAVLGVLGAGAAYVPCDPGHPPRRVARILDDSAAALTLVAPRLAGLLPEGAAAWTPEEDAGETDAPGGAPVGAPELPAYVLYTSGSTGVPKGVEVSHASLSHYVGWAREVYGTGADGEAGAPAAWAFHTSLAFDLTNTSLFVPLATGGRLLVYPPRAEEFPILDVVADDRAEVVKLTPSHLELLVPGEYPVSRLRHFVVGGEKLDRELAAAVHRAFGGRVEILNEYGPTETTVGCMLHRFDPEAARRPGVPIGGPAARTRLLVLSPDLSPTAPSQIGELYVAGAGVALGYVGRPGRTAQSFLPDLYAPGKGGGRMYRTGDRVRRLPEGGLDFVGRVDRQVKLRGFRIELEEIGRTLAEHPGIRGAVARLFEEERGAVLVGYYAARRPVEEEELRTFLAERLPGETVPSLFVHLRRLPLTLNGKLNLDALPGLEEVRRQARPEHTPPRTPTEALVCEHLARLLGIERVGVHDNFFQLGGDSILSIRLVAELNPHGFDLVPRQVFQNQTSAQLAEAAESGRIGKAGVAPDLSEEQRRQVARLTGELRERLVGDRDLEDLYPLTPVQRGLLFHSIDPDGGDVYFRQVPHDVQGDVDLGAFRRACGQLVARHPIFRTSFFWEDLAEPLQGVEAAAELPFRVVDLRRLAPAGAETAAEEYLAADRARGLDLSRAPLMRLAALRVEDCHTRLVWSSHHLVIDGWSVTLLLAELFERYEALRRGRELHRPPTPPFRDYVAWLGHQDMAAAEAFWRARLAGFDQPTPLAADRPAGDEAAAAHGQILARLSASDTGALEAWCRNHRLTPGTAVHAAWALLLSRYGGDGDVLFGGVSSGRSASLPGIETTLGVFVSTLPMRVRVRGDRSPRVWLEELQEELAAAREYEYTPLARTQGWSEIPRGEPFFHTIMTVETYPSGDGTLGGERSGELEVEQVDIPQATNYPLTFMASLGGELGVALIYDRRRFDRTSVERRLGHLAALLVGFASHSGPVAEMPMLRAAERAQLLRAWNDTASPELAAAAGDRLLHDPFLERAAERPDGTAVRFGDEHWTYGAMERRSRRLALALARRGTRPGERVAVYLQRSAAMVPVLLGILRAGAVYVPLDADYPPRRVQWILGALGVRRVLTGAGRAEDVAALAPELPELRELVLVDGEPPSYRGNGRLEVWAEAELDNEALQGESEAGTREDLPPRAAPDEEAYVIFTSGSTGRPKGVVLRHRPVVNLITWVNRTFDVGPDDRLLATASLSFDLSVYDLFGILGAGGVVVPASSAELRDPEALLALLRRQAITFWDSAPAALQQLVPLLPARLPPGAPTPALRLVFFSGDWIPVRLPDQVRGAFPGAEVVALGGATEAAIWSNFYRVREVGETWPSIPYGRPIAHARYHVLGPDLAPRPIGVPGDLFIAGGCLASGYAAQPGLTADRFLPDPFAADAAPGSADPAAIFPTRGARLYRTGDRARYLADGNIEFLGRLDHQVKLRGFRIELGEVESVLARHPSVATAVSVIREDAPGHRRLAAYVVPPEGAELGPDDLRDLREHLREHLPAYMVPSALVPLAEIPLTANGKLDRRALPVPEAGALGEEASRAAEAETAPRGELERVLAAVWAEVLPVERVGVHDDFFELGGDSILSIQIVSRARRAGIEITAAQVFETPTVARLAAEVRWAPAVAEAAAAAEVRSGPVPLVPAQHWLFHHDPVAPHHFNQALYLAVPGDLDGGALALAWHSLAEVHETLRLRFERRPEGGWRQVLPPVGRGNGSTPTALLFHEVDLRRPATGAGAEDGGGAELLTEIASRAQASLDLERGPLGRAVRIRLDAPEDRLLLVLHHLVVDAVSWRILLDDLEVLYRRAVMETAAVTNGVVAADLPAVDPVPVSFSAWADAVAAHAASPALAEELPYWRRTAERSTPFLPRDFEGAGTSASTDAVRVVYDEEQTAALLREAPAAYRGRLLELLLAALVGAVHGWTGSDRVSLVLEGHGREDLEQPRDLSRTVGWLTSFYPVVVDLPTGPSGRALEPAEILAGAKAALREVPGRGVGYGLLRYLRPGTGLGGAEPEISFNYLGQLDAGLDAGPSTAEGDGGPSPFRPAPESPGPTRDPGQERTYLLEVEARILRGRLEVALLYSRNVYRRETIEGLTAAYSAFVGHLLRERSRPSPRAFLPEDLPQSRFLADLEAAELAAIEGRYAGRYGGIEDIYPLAPLQEGLLFHTLYAPDSGVYLTNFHWTFRGALDPEPLRRAWEHVIGRHTALRTAFVWEYLERPMQVVLRRVELPWEEHDRRGDAGWEEYVRELVRRERSRSFDVQRPPLLRLHLVRGQGDHHALIWTLHHLLMDGWSVSHIFREVLTAWGAFARGGVPQLGESRAFGEHIAWLQKQDPERALDFWRRMLEDFRRPTPLPFPGGDPSRAEAREGGGLITLDRVLPEAASTRIRDLARSLGVTLNTVVQGAWALLLARRSGLRDVVFGAVSAGRTDDSGGVGVMVGMFINTLPVRVRFEEGESLRPWLRRIQRHNVELREFEHTPLVDIQELSGVERGRPLFETLLAFQSFPAVIEEGVEKTGVLGLEVVAAGGSDRSNYPLVVTVHPGREITFELTGDGGRTDESALDDLFREMSEVLEGMAAAPDARPEDLLGAVEGAEPEAGEAAAAAAETVPAAVPVAPGPEGQLAWWRDHLAGVPSELELPLDRPRGSGPEAASGRRVLALGREPAEAARALARQRGTGLFAVTLAAWLALLGRYSGQRRLTVGTPVVREGLGDPVSNVVVLRGDLRGEPSFSELLGRVRDVVAAVRPYAEFPYETLVAELAPEHDPAYAPFAQALFFAAASSGNAGSGVPFDLAVSVSPSMPIGGAADGELAVAAEYRAALFDETTVERLLEHYRRFLASAVAAPDTPARSLGGPSPAEAQQVLREWNEVVVEAPRRCLHEVFFAHASSAPDAPAVVYGDDVLTYAELAQRVARLARTLRARGCRGEQPVGVCLARSTDLVVGLLGVLAAGGAYVPLDPTLPGERLELMLGDALGPDGGLVVADPGEAARFPGRTVVGPRDGEPAGTAPVPPAEVGGDTAFHPDQLAYVLYTSGSTGRPKGVEVSHANVRRLFSSTGERFGFGAGDVWTLFHTYAFDFSVWELWGAFLHGGCLVVVPYEVSRSPEAFRRLLLDARVTVLNQTPTAFRQLIAADGASRQGAETGEERFALRWVFLGGEALSPSALRPWLERHGYTSPTLINMYGITEATVATALHPVTPGDLDEAEHIPISHVLDDTRLLLADAAFRPVPAGPQGEMLVGGPSLARGYHRRPGLTAERFVPDALGGEAGARLYRSGDLARYHGGGGLQYLGRGDRQIKLRGFRIELGEIESALDRLPGIREGAAALHEEPDGEAALVAYLVPEAAGGSLPPVRELRTELLRGLPDYMVPTVFLPLAELPLSSSGKLDRGALPDPGAFAEGLAAGAGAGAAAEAAYLPPSTAVEEIVAGIWTEVLQLDRVGREESFFLLGGHSLLAVRTLSRVRSVFEVELPLQALFEAPTVEEFSRRVESALSGGGEAAPPLLSARPEDEREAGPPPLSFAQQRLWFIDQLEPGSASYNIPVILGMEGSLEVAALGRGLGEIVRRHEALRTVFPVVGGVAVQKVLPAGPLPLPVVDLTGLGDGDRDAAAGELARAEALRSFRLDTGPLMRAALLRRGPEAHTLLVTQHHIVSDGWSMGTLVAEIGALYRAYRAGEPSPLPELPLQYTDFARWQRSWLRGEVLEEEVAWWRDRLADVPPELELPLDRPRGAVESSRGAYRQRPIPASLAAAVGSSVNRLGATAFMVTLTGLFGVLGRYSGQRRIAVGSPVSGRSQLELEGLVGFFVNTLVLRGDLRGEPGFSELVSRIRETVLAAHRHQDLPFEKLVEELAPERSLSHSPFFQVLFALERSEPGSLRLPGLRLRSEAPPRDSAKFDLSVTVTGWDAAPVLGVEYRTALFDETTIDRLAGHFVRFLESGLADPARPVSRLGLLAPSEAQQVLREWNDLDVAPPARLCLHEVLLGHADRTPDATALVCGDGILTYSELAERVTRLAGALRARGCEVEQAVGVCIHRSMDLVVGLLGVLAAGGSYVPLDPTLPAERLDYMLGDALGSEGGLVVADGQSAGRFPTRTVLDPLLESGPIVEIGSEGKPPGTPAGELPPSLGPEQRAYILYTSGSTGRPKGVEITHANVLRLFSSTGRRFAFGADDTWTFFHTYAFDFSVWELWGALLHGGRLVVVPYEVSRSPEAFRRLLLDQRVTVLNQTPTAFRQLIAADGAARQGSGKEGDRFALRWVFLGGEALGPTALRPWLERHGYTEPTLINMYGITEATVATALHPVTPEDLDESEHIPISHVLDDTRLLLAGAAYHPVPIGARGEMLVGGPSLARGYYGRPGLTAERFVPDGLSGEAGARLYRSGDLARHHVDGGMEYLGRGDHQIKLRGFRIELEEVESALYQVPGVREGAAALRDDGHGGTALVAYLVPEPGGEGLPGVRQLRAELLRWLPDYMVPSIFVPLVELPLSSSGKLDRGALPGPESWTGDFEAPGGASRSGEVTYLPPRTAAEELVAGIWAEVLGLDRVGREESFFLLGGHSLLATRAQARVSSAFGVELPLRDLFEAPTVEEFSQRVESALSGGGEAVPPLLPARFEAGEESGPPPLSFAQQRLWFIDQLEPGSPSYNIPVILAVEGSLDVAALGRSLSEIVRRHEALRTVFPMAGGEAVQKVLPPGPLPLLVVDLTRLGDDERDAAGGELARIEALRPFRLDTGPLVRAALLRRGPEAHTLLVTQHHIVSDGWSMGVLVAEIGALYRAYRAGEPSPLPELPVQYTDFARWQRSWLRGEVLEEEVAWWRDRLADVPPELELPLDRPRGAVEISRGAYRQRPLPSSLVTAVQSSVDRLGATAFMVTLAGFFGLLGRYSGQRRLAVGTPVSGRSQLELEGLVGFFVNTLVLRADLQGEPSFGELLARTRETVLAAHAHQHLPFEKLVEELVSERSLSHSPFFQVTFSLGVAEPDVLRLSGLRLRSENPPPESAKFDLSVTVTGWGKSPVLGVEYRPALFDETTIDRLQGHFLRCLAEGVNHPERLVSQLVLMTPAEAQQLLREWGTGADLRDALPLEPEGVVGWMTHPRAGAVVRCGEHEMTHGELFDLALRWGRSLRARGVGPEVAVGLLIDRRLDMVWGLLGILAARGVCVPLDPSWPEERLAYVLEETGAEVLLTRKGLFEEVPESVASRTCLDLGGEDLSLTKGSPLPLRHTGLSESLAYVIFTSGSTGRPKGVGVSRGALDRHLGEIVTAYGLVSEDRSLQFSIATFDVFFEQVLASLRVGASLVLRGEELWSPRELDQVIREQGLTVINLPTGYWAQWAEETRLLDAGELCSLRLVVTGGDVMAASSARLWHRSRTTGGWCGALLNAYGPTEGVITSTLWEVPSDGAWPAVSIGSPLPARTVLILDARGIPVPMGMTGELYLGGSILSRGYLGKPRETAESFVPDPFGAIPGGRLYRTGDLVRRRSSGELEFLGRRDRQVKIRGFRVELGEIEKRLGQVVGVTQCVVLVREDGLGGSRLVAYLVLGESATPSLSEVREELRRHLPAYMIPGSFVILEAMPLTPNGKVDRRALPLPSSPEEGARYLPPRTLVERLVAGVWEEVLVLPQVGRNDDFFALGGHSLSAMKVVSRLRSRLDVELPVRELFEWPTLSALSDRVEDALREGAGPGSSIEPVSRDGRLPLSYPQEGLWFLEQLAPGGSAYHIPISVHLPPATDAVVLRRALGEVVRRHEALRTCFPLEDGQPWQEITQPGRTELPRVDLSSLAEGDRSGALAALLDKEAHIPFDLSTGPLWRGRFYRLGSERESVLSLTFHHIVADGWSMAVMRRELTALYGAFIRGELTPLAPLSVQYADYAVWQRNLLTGEAVESLLAYWRDHLAPPLEPLGVPRDRPRPRQSTGRGASAAGRLSAAVTESLDQLARKTGTTLYMVLLAAVGAVLSRWTGARDLRLGMPVAGRGRRELEPLIGFFINILVVRTRLEGDPPFAELLGRVREAVLGAHTHQDLPFDELVKALNLPRDTGADSLVEVVVNMMNVPAESASAERGASRRESLTAAPPEIGAKFDLTLYAQEEPDGLALVWRYDPDLFDASTVARLEDRLGRMLRAVAEAPERRLSALPGMSAPERHQVAWEWEPGAGLARQARHRRELLLHEGVERRARAAPDAVALVLGVEQWTYGELQARAERVASHLASRSLGPEDTVALLVRRSPAMVMAYLGVLAAGATVMPLDAESPSGRLHQLIRQARCRWLVTEEHFASELTAETDEEGLVTDEMEVMYLDDSTGRAVLSGARPAGQAGADRVFRRPSISPDQPAYVVFTSGSTGAPKGVVTTHRGASAFLAYLTSVWELTPVEVVLQLPPLSFDASVRDLMGTLWAGGRLVLMEEGATRDPSILAEALATHRVTALLSVVPSLLAGLVSTVSRRGRHFEGMRLVLTSGEALDPSLCRKVYELADGPFRLVNQYGATEATMASTYSLVPRFATGASELPSSISAGRPVPGWESRLLNQGLERVGIGVPGQVFFGGPGLARGYLGQPALTAERFVPDPYEAAPGARLYATRDLARRRPGGELELMGRLDHQVKLRGFRIEPREVEVAVSALEGVEQAVVVVRGEGTDAAALIAYATPVPGHTLDGRELRQDLAERLPPHLVPASVEVLAAMPVTPHGKVDRKALPAPSGPLRSGAFVPPRDLVELRLVKIWERILDRRPVGVQDSFFDLGGHSLLAVRLVASLESALGRSLPVATLFENPTVERLARLVRESEKGIEPPNLVELQQGRNGAAPLYFVHPIGGDIFCYGALARHLGDQRGFLAFRSRGLDGIGAPIRRVEEMASAYLEELRARGEAGPYLLGGWSLGGLIAWEMARQLEGRGEPVALVALLDSKAVPRDRGELRGTALLADFALHMGLSTEELKGIGDGPEELADRDRHRALAELLGRAQKIGAAPPDIGLERMESLFEVFRANAEAIRQHRPRPGRAPVKLWRASDSPEAEIDPTLGWGDLAQGGLEVFDVPGDHFAIVQEPQVQVVAETLRAWLLRNEES